MRLAYRGGSYRSPYFGGGRTVAQPQAPAVGTDQVSPSSDVAVNSDPTIPSDNSPAPAALAPDASTPDQGSGLPMGMWDSNAQGGLPPQLQPQPSPYQNSVTGIQGDAGGTANQAAATPNLNVGRPPFNPYGGGPQMQRPGMGRYYGGGDGGRGGGYYQGGGGPQGGQFGYGRQDGPGGLGGGYGGGYQGGGQGGGYYQGGGQQGYGRTDRDSQWSRPQQRPSQQYQQGGGYGGGGGYQSQQRQQGGYQGGQGGYGGAYGRQDTQGPSYQSRYATGSGNSQRQSF